MKFIKIIQKVIIPLRIIIMVLMANHSIAQSVGIASTVITPDASSILEMRSTSRGMLIPRMTTAQRDAINSGSFATGLMIYNMDTNNFNYWNGTAWLILQRNNSAITAATNTKITYDANGLVTAGAAATTADIAPSTNRNYVTDAQQTVIANTSGTNTGDQTSVTGNAGTATSFATGRTIGITGDVTYTSPTFNGTSNITAAAAVTRINGTALSGLATGILKNTTATGVPTIAVAGTDFVAPNTAIAGATNTKITYDAKGLVTAGAQASAANLSNGTTGSGNIVLATSPVLITPNLGTPSAGIATNLTGTAAGLTAGTVTTNANLTGDVTSVGNASTVVKINGTALSGLATGILKNTTATGVPTIAVAGTDFVAPNSAIAGATNTKITYDAKGLVTSGGSATTADIAPSTNRNYVTDAQQTVIANTSGINTGDQTSVTGNAGTATSLATGRTIGITGDVTYTSPTFNGTSNITAAAIVTRINGTALSGLATGILKNTTATGVPTIAVAGTDYATPGTLIKYSVITSGTSFTLDPNTTKFVIEIAGAGGGGGGVVKAGGNKLAVGSGGGGGGYLKKFITVVSGSPSFSIGTGGTAGSNAGGSGGSGGSTSFTYNSITYTANGGAGGAGDANGGSSISIVSSGAAGTASGGDINLTGVDGAPGLTLSNSVGTSGNGGNSYLGNTSRSLTASGDGISGTAFGYGVGGSGAFDNNTSARVGGAGSSGVVIIWEYK